MASEKNHKFKATGRERFLIYQPTEPSVMHFPLEDNTVSYVL